MAADSIPKRQRAAVLRGPYGERHSFETDFPVKQPGPGEVLIRIESAGICAGDVHSRDGQPPAPTNAVRPIVAGHEGIGYIVALGTQVNSAHFRLHQRVGMGWRRSTCGECAQCNTGAENLCPKQVVNGFANDGAFQVVNAIGGSEYVVMPSSDLISIPSMQRSAGEIAPLLCSGGTALAGVRAAGLNAGDWLCVVGAAGGVGSLALQYGKHLGYKVVAIDSEKKRHHCEALGIEFVEYEDAENIVHRVIEITGEGPKGTVICSASPASYSQAVEYSAIGATIVSIGPSMIHLHTGQLMQKGIKLVAQRNGTKKDIVDALAFGNEGIIPTVQIMPFESLDVCLDKLKSGQVVGRQVMVFT